MENVRFESDERVDIPDAQALAMLWTYEFRRTIRGLLLGESENKVINGFRCVASGPPSAFVNVVLDPGGGAWLSHAIGTHLLDAVNDRGVLIGGNNSFAQLGGNASYPVDFTGQPNGNYIVEMRFTLIPGKLDNRVFVNPTTHVENTQQINTRHVPALEVRRIGGTVPTGGQWMPIAQIAWAGATISSGDITDRRIFAMEGDALAGFQRNGWGATGGVPDFNRSVDRANIGLNALYPLARALMRQVQDMKGRTGGLLDWFARGAQPMRTGSGQLTAADQTKGLAESSDTCVFTVGDGVSEWGDFNGATGLQTCLTHIASQKANLPGVVRIVLKRRAAPEALASGFAWTLSTPVDLSDISVIIDGTTGGGHLDGSSAKQPQAPIDFTHAGNSTPFFAATTGSSDVRLTLINLANVLPHAAKVVNPIATVRRMTVRECSLTVSDVASHAVQCVSPQALIENSKIEGDIYFYGGSASAGSATPFGIVRGLMGRVTASSNTGKATILRTVGGLSGAGHGLLVTGSQFLRMEGTQTSRVTVENCDIVAGFEDGIRIGGATGVNDWTLRNLRFTRSSAVAGGHSAGAGTNGAAGTGWNVYIIGGAGDTIRSRSIRIEGMRCLGVPGIDAGLVRAEDCQGLTVRGIDLSDVVVDATALACTGVHTENVQDVWIEECTSNGISGGGASFIFRHVRLAGSTAFNVYVERNTFSVLAGWSALSMALLGESSNMRNIWFECNRCLTGNDRWVWFNIGADVSRVYVEDNAFDPTNSASCVFDITGFLDHLHIKGNSIASTSTTLGAQLMETNSAVVVREADISHNTLRCPDTASPSRGAALAHVRGAVDGLSIIGNRVYGAQESGVGAPATLLRASNGGTGIHISGNTTEGAGTGDGAIVLTGMTGASLIMFHGNAIAGLVSTNNAGVGVWNADNYVTGTVTP